jgi:hypothetical protein
MALGSLPHTSPRLRQEPDPTTAVPAQLISITLSMESHDLGLLVMDIWDLIVAGQNG